MNPATYLIDNLRNKFVVENIKAFCTKDTLFLDLGCGNKPFEKYYKSQVKNSVGIDVETSPHNPAKPDFIYNGINIPDQLGKFNFILCTEVLEHVSEPNLLLAEMNRVLNDWGMLLVTTPFFIGVHEPPYDFYRYTEYGLQYLFEKNGFMVVKKVLFGGSLGVILMLLSKPQMKTWSWFAKKLNLLFLNSIFNPFVFLFIFLPQWFYLTIQKVWPFGSSNSGKKVPIGYGYLVQKQNNRYQS